MRINCNFVTMVNLTSNKRCLIYNLRVEKLWGSKKMKMLSNKRTHLNCK